jgi:hypothetical protein
MLPVPETLLRAPVPWLRGFWSGAQQAVAGSLPGTIECASRDIPTPTSFSQDDKKVTEKDISIKVNRTTLLELMAKTGGLDDRCVRWKGFQDRALLAGIVGFDRPCVPLVEYGQLHKVVSRHSVVEEIAAKALK